MADQSKTEKATPKKRQDERKKGNVFISKDVVNVVSLLGIFVGLKILFPWIYINLKDLIHKFILISEHPGTLKTTDFTFIKAQAFIGFFKIITPVILIALISSVIPVVFQTKGLFAKEALKVKFNRLNPLNGLKNMISMRALLEIVKGLLKITVITYVLYSYINSNLHIFGNMFDYEIGQSIKIMLTLAFNLVIRVCAVFIVIAAFDYLYSWWEYEKKIKMSKQEVKEEYKQMEGDPQIKAKIKERQKAVAMSRMMQQVPTADVVIRNPTHYAVALKYKINEDIAPKVVAKGQDFVAGRIVKIAEENNVPTVENVQLARALYATAEVDSYIPGEYYGAIAEILAVIYTANEKNGK